MNLTEQAKSIILQSDRTPDDILKLSQLSFRMSLLYKQAREESAKMEREYNKERPRATLESKERKISMAQAEQEGKLFAETYYGQHRVSYEECVGMRSILDQIDAFRIAYYRREKGIDSVLGK